MLRSYLTSQKGFFLNFYSRRIRRILPSALLVTAVTIWATNRFLGPVASNNATLDGGWATVFLSNFHFQNSALDYFATGAQPSVLQHYWSLSIEEQFYLIWPALFVLLFIKSISLRARQIIITSVIALSLSTATYQSFVNQSPIFFSTWTRIWELAVGALLAITSRTIQLPRFVSSILIFLTTVAAFVIPQTMQWPRVTTIPIVAATAVVLIRNPRLGAFWLLENRFATYLGDLSYIIYLWHWPVLTISKGYYGKFGASEILIVLAVTALLSVATHHLFENPLRYSKILSAKPALTVIAGIVAIATAATTLFTNYQG